MGYDNMDDWMNHRGPTYSSKETVPKKRKKSMSKSIPLYVIIEIVSEWESVEVCQAVVAKGLTGAKNLVAQMYEEQLNPEDGEEANRAKVIKLKKGLKVDSFVSLGNWHAIIKKAKTLER